MADDALEADDAAFTPRFDANGLIPAMVVAADDHAPLMFAWMDREALDRTIETGEAHFHSRSRAALWHKGATSGNVLSVREIRTDCDQDVVWLAVDIAGHGGACHTGHRSCFYRKVGDDGRLAPTGDPVVFDPKAVYGG